MPLAEAGPTSQGEVSGREPEGGFALYVHWPFCLSKCPYCDFNSHVRSTVDQAAWREALLRELRSMADRYDRWRLRSIFFGGGTPSLMPAETVEGVIDAAAAGFGFEDGIEITLEANPTSVEAQRFFDFARAGVNRVSVGVQALDDAALTRLGRTHTVADALDGLDVARKSFARVSFDLIYARPYQSLAAWRAELGRALAMGPDHLSLYQLTIEPGTRFADLHAAGKLAIPDGDFAGDLYALTQEMCAAAGLPAYEISNHARAGAESRHNLVYWRYGQYVGIGPGAYGRVVQDGETVSTETVRSPEAWLTAVGLQGCGLAAETVIPRAAQAEEMMMMGLRLREGVSLGRYSRIGGEAIPPEKLARLAEIGMLAVDGERVRVTEAGRPVLNAVLGELLA